MWVLTLVGATLPAVGLLFGVRWVADRIEPGYGTAAAITLGLGSIVMVFAAEYFAHVIAAGLGFAAFALLFRERERGAARLGLVGAAGLAAGLAVSFEYPLALVGAILFVYALGDPVAGSLAAPRIWAGRSPVPRRLCLQLVVARLAAAVCVLGCGRGSRLHRARRARAQ